jgi:hypothetical protein
MSSRAYHDEPGVGVFAAPELVPGTSNLMEYLAVSADDELLVMAEYPVDPVVVAAIAAAGRAAGARVSTLLVEPFSPGGTDRGSPSPVAVGAWQHATAVVSCVWWAEVHTQPLFFTELGSLGVRLAALHQTATLGAFTTGARLPPPVFYETKARVLEQLVGAEEVRVQTRLGTDFTMRGLRVDTDNGPLVDQGTWSPFPYGGVNWYPSDASGVVAIEESTVTGRPVTPLRIHLADNRVVDVDGGPEAAFIQAFSPSGYYLRHAFIGLNPKVRLGSAPQFEREKHAGAFYFGLDALAAADRGGPGYAHCDCQFDTPTITVDGKVVVDDGYLLALRHEAVRAAAARFGDPDRLLLPNSYLW